MVYLLQQTDDAGPADCPEENLRRAGNQKEENNP